MQLCCAKLKQIWDEFPVDSVQNFYCGNGYVDEEGVDNSGFTDSESEAESESNE